VRGHPSKAHSEIGLAEVIRETTRLWRKHALGDDQTKYVVEHVRRQLALAAPRGRRRSLDRLNRFEVERLIQAAYRTGSRHGLMIKTLFLTGARVSESVQVRVEDLHLDSDRPRSTSSMPRLDQPATCLSRPASPRSSARASRHAAAATCSKVIAIPTTPCAPCRRRVAACAREADIAKRVYPHLLRHSIATILLDSGQVPIDQVQKLLGHQRLSTTQIYAETCVRALGDNYLRALSSPG
jgi:integrase/recombinase XerD